MESGYTRLKSGAIRWRVMVDGVRYTGTEPNLGLARIARAQAIYDAGGTTELDPTVAELLEAHIAHETRARTTLDNWTWALKHLPAPFLARRASEVTPPVVAALWRQIKDSPPHRLVKTFNLCSSAWQTAQALGMVRSNPWRIVPNPPPPPADRIVPPTVADVKALFAAATDPTFNVWLRLAAGIGARGGELCGLQWDDVLVDRGVIRIERSVTRRGEVTIGKTGVSGHRTVPLDLPTMTRLRKVPRIVGCPWVFNRAGIDPWRPDGAAKQLVKVCEAAKVNVSPHDLRHFAVTQMLARKWPAVTVATLIGDSPRTVMQTYAHWVPEQGREAVEQLGALLDG